MVMPLLVPPLLPQCIRPLCPIPFSPSFSSPPSLSSSPPLSPSLPLSLLPVLNGLLERMEMSVRIPVGQALALLFELARETDEEVCVCVCVTFSVLSFMCST